MNTQFFIDNLTVLLYIPSVITFLLFAWDKHQAVYERSRVPDVLLWVCTLLFGAFGALCGMILFNHMSRRKPYLIGVPILLVLQLTAVVLLKVLS